MAIKAKTMIVGGKVVVGSPEVEEVAVKKASLQELVETSSPKIRIKKAKPPGRPAQDMTVTSAPTERQKFLRAPNRAAQDHTETTTPVERFEPDPVRYSSPQEIVHDDILGEPKLAKTKNGFILHGSSKFHRDMTE